MMPRLESTDKVALVIGAILIVGGFFALLIPQDFAFGRATNFLRVRPQTIAEHVSTRQSRIYGLAGIIVGAGLSTYVVWASRRP
jgi:dipeptide/tripeptide permease